MISKTLSQVLLFVLQQRRLARESLRLPILVPILKPTSPRAFAGGQSLHDPHDKEA